VLSFGPDAEALAPPELRDDVIRRLEAAIAVH
jgi:predicted DNA-binding transcriptional regulator YafY